MYTIISTLILLSTVASLVALFKKGQALRRMTAAYEMVQTQLSQKLVVHIELTWLQDLIVLQADSAKFVVYEMVDYAAGTRTYGLVSREVRYHRELRRELSSGARILGGGMLHLDHIGKTMFAIGSSGSYGACDGTLLETIIRSALHLYTEGWKYHGIKSDHVFTAQYTVGVVEKNGDVVQMDVVELLRFLGVMQ